VKTKNYDKESYSLLIKTLGKYKLMFFISTPDENTIIQKIESAARIVEPI